MTAVASFLEARRHGGQWLVRVEDIDPPRAQPGASNDIIEALERHQFAWDGPVTFQSESRDAHEAAIRVLLESGQAYRCGCSRRELADAQRSALGIIYPGICRDGSDASEFALRVRTDNKPIQFDDQLQGPQSHALETESGDFIILRKDGLIAYQLAVVVDDEHQGITDVVRGIDLLDSTPRQVWLQHLLGYATPEYFHLPVAVNERGQKLSKSHGAPGVNLDTVETNLFAALQMLDQSPPQEIKVASLPELWQWAFENWDMSVLRGRSNIEPLDNRLW